MNENVKVLTFEEINRIDVSEHIEKKMNLSYLSWAWAWQEMKKIDENAKVVVHEFPEYIAVGDSVKEILKPYLSDKGGAWVKVSVTLNGRTETEYLPVMDMRNKAVVEPDATTINKNIKRCFVKALALHGLGLYVYSGEDVPEQEPAKKITAAQAKILEALVTKVSEASNGVAKKEALMTKLKVNDFTILTVDEYGNILNQLNAWKQAYEKKAKENKAAATPKKETPQQEEQETMLDRYGNPK